MSYGVNKTLGYQHKSLPDVTEQSGTANTRESITDEEETVPYRTQPRIFFTLPLPRSKMLVHVRRLAMLTRGSRATGGLMIGKATYIG